tara:strand:+ start:363 stop:755 length:393 start_codon:yes stop_codon:yes gene_type:complete
MWPVVSSLNPLMFYDKKLIKNTNPKRYTFVLGPVTWLSLSYDFYGFKSLSEEEKLNFLSYLKKGAHLWKRLSQNRRNYLKLIDEIPSSCKFEEEGVSSKFKSLRSIFIKKNSSNFTLLKAYKSLKKLTSI